MTRPCTKCGSLVEEIMKFCTHCGAPMTEPSTPARASPSLIGRIAVAETRTHSSPQILPEERENPGLKIVFVVLASLLLIAAAVKSYSVYKARRQAIGTVQPGGTLPQSKDTPEAGFEKGGAGSETEASATAGVPTYPGATPTEGGGELSLGGVGGISAQEYVTTARADKVVTFYKEKLGSEAHLEQSGRNTEFTLNTDRGTTTVTITPDEDASKTKIAIAHMGK